MKLHCSAGRISSAIVMLILLALVGGMACAPNRSTGTKVATPTGKKFEPRIIINDNRVRKSIAVDSVDCRMVNDVPQAQVVIRNTTKKTISFVYRFVWTDADGFDVPAGNTVWRDAYIEGFSVYRLAATAPSVGASSYRVEIQHKQ